ncbi:MAG: FAD-binding protein, partial [Muribaculaceae bacterium]|nr:FAD-binding protein [Muribaculaceae bacterium]
MVSEFLLRVLPEVAADESLLTKEISRIAEVGENRISGIKIIKKSIDARQRRVMINVKVRAWIDEPVSDELKDVYNPIDYKLLPEDAPQAIVVGAGPAGLFAALRLIELGVRPIVIERGKNVNDRRIDLAKISREDIINPESNYSFGEGGAGAYSDGKLYTRSKKRGSVDRILSILYQHGAPESILVDAHPHIGTDKLPIVIENIRKTIIRCGGEVHFETRVDSLIISDGKVKGVNTNTGASFGGPVILATGHSARDVYKFLYN